MYGNACTIDKGDPLKSMVINKPIIGDILPCCDIIRYYLLFSTSTTIFIILENLSRFIFKNISITNFSQLFIFILWHLFMTMLLLLILIYFNDRFASTIELQALKLYVRQRMRLMKNIRSSLDNLVNKDLSLMLRLKNY